MPSPCATTLSLASQPARRVLFIAAALLLGSTLQAQSDSTARDSVASLEMVVVEARKASAESYAVTTAASALRLNTPLRETPLSLTVVSSALIQDQRMTSLAEAVRYIPGVTMGQGEGHRDQPTIRGNNTTADFFVDGIRDDAQYIRDTYNLDRIESIRGSNAVSFGRGGGGGVINRVTKEARWGPFTEVSLEGGSHDHKRATLDVGRSGRSLAGRLNMVYQNSATYRDDVRLERFGINPTVTSQLGERTSLRAGYEYFRDHRTVDRGIPSFRGAPALTASSTFFGNPDSSYYDAEVQAAGVVLSADLGGGRSLRSNSRAARYDKFYQNVYPGAVDSSGTRVAISAYNSSALRTSLVNQTDLILPIRTGAVKHTLLLGAELGRSDTDHLRRTGYFNGTATSTTAEFDAPTVSTPVTFRPSATDADARVVLHTVSAVIQEQAHLAQWLQVTAAARAERFDLAFHNNRTDEKLSRDDVMISPRFGIVLLPSPTLSVYGSYSVSYLPGSGDQYSSLSVTSQMLEPERFVNEEVGIKWDPHARLALTGALYRLDRTNTTAYDPTDPSRIVQTGEQRSQGVELTATGSLTSAWQLIAVYGNQSATIRSRTTAAAVGATVPLVPRVTASLWNKYRVNSGLSVAAGVVHQARSYAAIDNAVTLPSFTRVDAAVYTRLADRVRLQLNVENVFDRSYYATAHSNNNITPGAPRTLKLSAILSQ